MRRTRRRPRDSAWDFCPARPSRLVQRLLFEVSFAASATRSLFAFGRQDAVLVFCPMFGAVLFGALRGAILREPLWLNIQDIPTDAWLAAGIVKRGLFSRVAEFAQRTSKLIPAISLATPILAISDLASPLGQEVTNHSLGLHFTWEHLKELEGQLVAASANAARQQHWQEKCEHHVCTYGKQHALDRYETLLKQLVGYGKV